MKTYPRILLSKAQLGKAGKGYRGQAPHSLQRIYEKQKAHAKRWEVVGTLLLALALILLMLGSTAMANTVNPTNVLQPYQDFRPPEDMATRLMEGLLGPVYTSPWTVGITSNTLFGAVFLVFNVIVFAVGTVFASYGVIAGIVQTAHEGVVLGKRMSAVWMPVRMVTGIGGLIPAFGGFSLSQVVMIVATSWGISFGNYVYDQALQKAATTATLVNASFSRTDPKKDPNAMAQALFSQRMCELAAQREVASYLAKGQSVPPDLDIKTRPIDTVIKNGGTIVGRAVGSEFRPSECFAVAIKRKTKFFGMADQAARSGSSWFGFRTNAVDYEAIATQAWTGYSTNFNEFVTRIHTLADAYDRALRTSTVAVIAPKQEIRAVGIWYGGAVQSSGQGLEIKKIKDAALTNMGKYGFFSAGSYYSTYAEVSAAVMEAGDVTEFLIFAPPPSNKIRSGDFTANYGIAEQPTFANADQAAAQAAVSQGADAPKSCPWLLGASANDTGNCSLGQKFVGLALQAGTAGSGGTSTMVDPIIALKNIGDYMMVIGEIILISSLKSDSEPAAAPEREESGGILSKIPLVGWAIGAASSLASDMVKALGVMAPYIGGLMFSVGALCAIYLPMVPFINWVSALVQYCCIVVESIAAAPLWAFAHLQADGEGMGQRTERGYIYWMNLLFRPMLMVIAFFAASALIILLGSLVFQMFLPAMAAAQGNSVTGIFSAVGYVFLFFVIMNTMIQGLFHLVMDLPDDVIGWVGGIGKSQMGKDTEGKVSNMFMAGGRFGASGVQQIGQKLAGGGGVTPGARRGNLL